MAIVATTAGADDPARTVFVGQATQRSSCIRMRLFCIAKVGYRVALETVGTSLQQYEFRLCMVYEGLDAAPHYFEITVISACRHRNIELGSARTALPRFFGRTCSRIQMAAIFVDICKDQIRVIFKRVEHAVAMMRVDIDVGDALNAVLLAQLLGRDTKVIEDTKPCCVIAAGMV